MKIVPVLTFVYPSPQGMIVGNPGDEFVDAPDAIAEQAIAEGKAVPFDDGEPVDGSEDADDAAPVAPAAKGKRKGKDAAPVAPAAPVDPAADAPASDGTATTVDPDAAPIA